MLGDLANLHSDWWFLNAHCTKRTLYNCTSRTYFTLEDLKQQLSQYDNFNPVWSAGQSWQVQMEATLIRSHLLMAATALTRPHTLTENWLKWKMTLATGYVLLGNIWIWIWALSSLVSSQTTWCPPKCFTQWPMSPQAQPCPSWCQGRSCSNVRENEKHASAVPSWAPW